MSSNVTFGGAEPGYFSSGTFAMQQISTDPDSSNTSDSTIDKQAQLTSVTLERNANHAELYSLAQELRLAMDAREQAECARDAIAIDLLETRDDLAAKGEQLAKLSKALLTRTDNASTQDVSSHARSTVYSSDELEAKLAQAVQQVRELQTSLAAANAQMLVAPGTMIEQQTVMQQVGSQGTTLLPETETPMEWKPELGGGLEWLQRRTTKLEKDLNGQQQCAEQFRKISERLTSQLKHAEMAMRDLARSEQASKQQVKDLAMQLDSLHGRKQDDAAGVSGGVA